jgi:hypothetical protein
MKTKTEYKKITLADVPELTSEQRRNCAFKGTTGEWLRGELASVKLGTDCPFVEAKERHVSYQNCALVVESVEWEPGDTVEVVKDFGEIKAGEKGVVSGQVEGDVYVIFSDGSEMGGVLHFNNLKQWVPGYGYTPEGELIEAPEGWEIVPEGESFSRSQDGALGFVAGSWRELRNLGCGYTVARILPESDRAYARKVERVAKPGEVWKTAKLKLIVVCGNPGFAWRIDQSKLIRVVHDMQDRDTREVREANGDTFLAASLEEYFVGKRPRVTAEMVEECLETISIEGGGNIRANVIESEWMAEYLNDQLDEAE